MIKLPFAGVKGQPGSKPVTVSVPCVEMWQEPCPILAEVRTWFKDPNLEDMGRKYWKKRSYIFQGFVRENPLSDDKPENPIRRFIIGPQLYAPIKDALMDPELVELPTDYMQGLDFVIKKTSKGGFADYSTSKWARRESALTEEESTAIQQYGLNNLSEFLPKKPSALELDIIKQMFEDSVNGMPYDIDKYGQYYRPPGVQAPTAQSESAPAAPAAPAALAPAAAPAAPAAEPAPWEGNEHSSPSAPAEPAESPKAAANPQDILAMIRARSQ